MGSHNGRNDRHGTDGRKKEDRKGDGKSRQHLVEEKNGHASNGSNFTDAFRRIIDTKFDVFFDSVRSECKSYRQFLPEICSSHVNKGRNSFLQAAVSLKHPFNLCELSGRRAMLSYLESVSDELQRIDTAACEQLCHWEHLSHLLMESQTGASDGDKPKDNVAIRMESSCSRRCSSMCESAITWNESLIPFPVASPGVSVMTASQFRSDGCSAAAPMPGNRVKKGNRKGPKKSRPKDE